jgi:hypothetical protein
VGAVPPKTNKQTSEIRSQAACRPRVVFFISLLCVVEWRCLLFTVSAKSVLIQITRNKLTEPKMQSALTERIKLHKQITGL